MADEFLTQELPAIRRAQERSLAALDSLIRLVTWALWREWNPPRMQIMSLETTVSALDGFDKRPLPSPSFENESEKPRTLTLSTAAACLDAIHSIADARGIQGLPKAGPVRATARELRDRMLLEFEDVTSRLEETASPMFGPNDPLTMSLLLPIIHRPAWQRAEGPIEQVAPIDVRVGSVRVPDHVTASLDRLLSTNERMIKGTEGNENTADDHPWPASLAVRALNLVTGGVPEDTLDESKVDDIREWSERQVRLQLALSVTNEAGQDGAHLAAGLATAMWLDEVPLPLLEAAISVLCEMQRPDGSFPLNSAFLANNQGSVNTPLQADLTLSMIAVADQLGVRYPEHPTMLRLQHQVLGAVERQREWFFRSSMRGHWPTENGDSGMVWALENAKSSRGTCSTWATARTATALAMILNLEGRLITRRLLEESRFSYRQARAIEKGFADFVDPERSSSEQTPQGALVSTLSGDFAAPQGHMRSVLLSGPPGTSKTSLVEAVAKELDQCLVQLSPADFLLDGPSHVEQRAKRIFDYLTEMEDVVVLFDEIDRLILDRSTDAYEKQEDVFQFMTPSMLPKLKSLRDRDVVRFAIATNYQERIDPAIVRPGRIDRPFVVRPPNRDARAQILKTFGMEPAEALAAVTPLWVYGDLRALRLSDPDEVIKLQPSIGLDSYHKRRAATAQESVLADEILLIAELYLEAIDVLRRRGNPEQEPIGWALRRARDQETVERVRQGLSDAGLLKSLPAWDGNL